MSFRKGLEVPGRPIEEALDMCETGPMRGEEVSRERPNPYDGAPESELDVDRLMQRRHDFTMAQENREGDEMSGDDHSSGLQGEEPELSKQPHISNGIPGDENEHQERDFDESVARVFSLSEDQSKSSEGSSDRRRRYRA